MNDARMPLDDDRVIFYAGEHDVDVTGQVAELNRQQINTRVVLQSIPPGQGVADTYPFGLARETAYRSRGNQLIPTKTLIAHIGKMYSGLAFVTVSMARR